MLIEIKNIEQDHSGVFRRWFTCDNMDLFVWYNEECQVDSFQLTFSDLNGEYLVNWSADAGFQYAYPSRDNIEHVTHKASILVQPGRRFSLKRVFDKFISQSRIVNRELVRFISNRLIREETRMS